MLRACATRRVGTQFYRSFCISNARAFSLPNLRVHTRTISDWHKLRDNSEKEAQALAQKVLQPAPTEPTSTLFAFGWYKGTPETHVRELLRLENHVQLWPGRKESPKHDRTYAHLVFPSIEEASSYLERYSRKPTAVDGQNIVMQYLRPRPNRGRVLFFGRCAVTPERLAELVGEDGELDQVRPDKMNNYELRGNIDAKDQKSAMAILRRLRGLRASLGPKFRVDFAGNMPRAYAKKEKGLRIIQVPQSSE